MKRQQADDLTSQGRSTEGSGSGRGRGTSTGAKDVRTALGPNALWAPCLLVAVAVVVVSRDFFCLLYIKLALCLAPLRRGGSAAAAGQLHSARSHFLSCVLCLVGRQITVCLMPENQLSCVHGAAKCPAAAASQGAGHGTCVRGGVPSRTYGRRGSATC